MFNVDVKGERLLCLTKVKPIFVSIVITQGLNIIISLMWWTVRKLYLQLWHGKVEILLNQFLL